MELYLADAKWVCAFEKPQTDPSAFEKPATTVLSPYLKVTVAGACLQNYYY
jgi:cryptochrome